MGKEAASHLFIQVGPGHGPSLQDRLLCCKQALAVGWRLARCQGNTLLELALALDGVTAAGVLAAPQEGAGNWCPLLGHPVAASYGEGSMLS